MPMLSRSAGVKYNNMKEHGGENRQAILRRLKDKSAVITVDLVHTTYEGEPAIRLVEHSTRQTIGWIPKEDIQKVTNEGHKQLTGFIDETKNGLSVRLDVQKPPSKAQYAAVKAVCARNGMAMPAYDVRAYTPIFAMMRS